ncbi:MAG: hypothetical protein ABW186_05060 [Rhodanobacteraceae bacterium]
MTARFVSRVLTIFEAKADSSPAEGFVARRRGFGTHGVRARVRFSGSCATGARAQVHRAAASCSCRMKAVRYRFDHFVLGAAARELWRGGERISIRSNASRIRCSTTGAIRIGKRCRCT